MPISRTCQITNTEEHMTRSLLLCACAAIMLLSACSKDKPNAPDSPSAPEDAPKDRAPDERAGEDAPAHGGDAVNFSSRIDEIVAKCVVLEKVQQIKKCPEKQHMALVQAAADPNVALAQLPAILDELEHEDSKRSTVAAWASSKLFFNLGDSPDASKITEADVERALTILSTSHRYKRERILDMVTYTSALKGRSRKLIELAAEFEHQPQALRVYRSVMRYNPQDAFPALQALAKSEDDKVAAAALEGGLATASASSERREEICAWASNYVTAEAPTRVFNAAATVMTTCSSDGLEHVLSSMKQRLEAYRIDESDTRLLSALCNGQPPRPGAAGKASSEQCEQVEALLLEILEQKKVSAEARAQALHILYKRRGARSGELLESYSSSKQVELRRVAQSGLDALERARLEAEAASAKPKTKE